MTTGSRRKRGGGQWREACRLVVAGLLTLSGAGAGLAQPLEATYAGIAHLGNADEIERDYPITAPLVAAGAPGSRASDELLRRTGLRPNETYSLVADRLASLTAADGAVVLTDKLRIIGFGAEVRVSDSGTDTIYHAKNEEGITATDAPFTSYGTRHRSAFRFVEGMDPAVAFILSQDGGIKAATLFEDRVVMWSYFEVGYTTSIS